MSYLHSNIKYLRELKGLNQTQLADIVGKKKAVISVYEQGTSEPPLTTLLLLSNYFGFNIDSLIKLDLSNNQSIKLLDTENQNLLEKSNKTESEDYHKSYHNDYHKGYILDDNQDIERVEGRHIHLKEQSSHTAIQPLNQGLSPPEAEILKTEILYLKEILNSKDEVLKAKSEQIELLKDKVRTLQKQLNNLLNGKSDIQAVA